ncbi:uncharacterized protein LOC129787862 [Lutzomyia longipalpis]|uniref:uncharacterized protein LOC129787862 n=1 Tax=Lutzomyia longipalpis TaxID=7200 RepID=UPI0024841ABC|nr:uncharacterized protein LOC129787862 [Lutzomyia longipalpis]
MMCLPKAIFVVIAVCILTISQAENTYANGNPNEFPYHVRIAIDVSFLDLPLLGDIHLYREICQGAIISTTKVLTAASCIKDGEIIPILMAVKYTIVADDSGPSDPNVFSKVAARASITTEYNCEPQGNQFGVLEVDDPFIFNDDVDSLPLDLSYDYTKLFGDEKDFDFGFTMYSAQDDGELMPFKFDHMMFCNAFENSPQDIPPGTFCGFVSNGKDLKGQAKRGGAVFVNDNSDNKIIGIGVIIDFEYETTNPPGLVVGFYRFASLCEANGAD